MASARAVQGKREQALSAFRQAVLIDPSFVLPPEAGKKAKVLGEQVRARDGRNGPFIMTAQIPARASSGNPFVGRRVDGCEPRCAFDARRAHRDERNERRRVPIRRRCARSHRRGAP